MHRIVNDVIRRSIRPVLMQHFGDIELVRVEEGIVHVRLLGACSGCPSAAATLEEVVLAGLKAEIPEVREVILTQEVRQELLELARRILCDPERGRGQ